MGSASSSVMTSRAAREAAYWDEVYRPTGSEHDKFLWTKNREAQSYVTECFLRRVSRFSERRILSIGGGVDFLGVSLAKSGNHVVTVDVSAEAAMATRNLAGCQGVADNVTTLVGSSEEVVLDGRFDLVIAKRALHHMDIVRTVRRVHDWLVEGGIFLAEEPVCRLRALQWTHGKLPFSACSPRTDDERELIEQDLRLIRQTFSTVTISYFDFLTRESVAYFLCKARMAWLLRPLGRADYLLINRGVPILSLVGSYAIIEATK